MPKEEMNRRDYRAAKFGSWGRSLALDAQLAEVGWAEGIRFAFEKIGRTPDTLDAHRLIRLADLDRGLVEMETFVARAGLVADMPQRDALSPRLEKLEAYLKAARLAHDVRPIRQLLTRLHGASVDTEQGLSSEQ